jgi:hypothetical protein
MPETGSRGQGPIVPWSLGPLVGSTGGCGDTIPGGAPVSRDVRIGGRCGTPGGLGGDMNDYDIHIKGGIVVDGTRVPRYRGDVWIKDGRVAQIGGRVNGGAEQVIDAEGLIVAPGFVDLHTHYGIRGAPSRDGTGSPRWCSATVGSGSRR